MPRIPYRGKDTQLVSVGPSLGFDYTTVQAALDAIVAAADAAADNPYLVTVAPGRYTGQVEVNSSLLSYVTVLGEPGAQLYDATGTAGAGTVRLIPASGELVSFTLQGLTIIASTTGQGVALAVGDASEGADASGTTARTFDEITIRDCLIVSGETALDVCGTEEGVATEPGRLSLVNNRVYGKTEIALAYQGDMKLLSRGNYYEAGSRAPFSVTGTGARSLTAARYNHDPGGSGGEHANSDCLFIADVFRTWVADGDVPLSGNVGGWLEERTGPGNTGHIPQRFQGCEFDVWYDASSGLLDTSITAAVFWDGSGVPTRETLSFQNCSLRFVLGPNSDYTGSAKAFIAGGSPGSAAACELAFCTLFVEDQAAGGGTMYGFEVNNANSTVHHYCVSEPNTFLNSAGAESTITILT